MQSEFLSQLSEPLKQFIHDVENAAGICINVIHDSRQNEGGTYGHGFLSIEIKPNLVRLFAPSNGYFPNGAVRHEVLHVKRFLVEGVPKLILAHNVKWDSSLADGLTMLDNAIEHLVIVPIEIQFHPERRTHWEAVIKNVCEGLPSIPEGERRLAVCLHWVFIKHVLPASSSMELLRKFAKEHGLLEFADRLAVQILANLSCKEELVQLLVRNFPEARWERAALEYLKKH